MKNIHVLPTDKPSRLYLEFGDGDLCLANNILPQTKRSNNQHIYITSNEEIKEGEYALLGGSILSYHQMHKKWGMPQGLKIILTTDQDLIKDGVQAIDNDFLEWFVKNISCESVEIERLENGCIVVRYLNKKNNEH
jgi:hypothetical protein